jgi:hypothetical protein
MLPRVILVMEVELNEPGLFCLLAPEAADAFPVSIVQRRRWART